MKMLRKQSRVSKDVYQSLLCHSKSNVHCRSHLLSSSLTPFATPSNLRHCRSRSLFKCTPLLCHHNNSGFHSSPRLREQEQLQKTEEDAPSTVETKDERITKEPHTEETRSAKIDFIVDEISKLNLLEVAQLVSALKSTLNLPDTAMMGAAMPMAAAPVAAGGGADDAEAEPEITQTIFDVVLKGYSAEKKVQIIKEVRGIYKLGLKEAKALVEKAPCTLQAQAPKIEADEVKEKLEAIGAEIVLE